MEEVIKLLIRVPQEYLELKTIKRILDPSQDSKIKKRFTSGELSYIKRVAVNNSTHHQIDEQTLNEWKNTEDWRLIAYIAQKGAEGVNPELLRSLATQSDYNEALFGNCKDLPIELPIEILLDPNFLKLRKLRRPVAEWFKGKDIPAPIIDKLLASHRCEANVAALYTYLGKDSSSLEYSEWQRAWSINFSKSYLSFAEKALVESLAKAPDLPEELLKEWLNGDWLANKLIIDALAQRKDHTELLFEGLHFPDVDVKKAAAKGFRTRSIPIEEIDKLRNHQDWEYRAASMYAAAGQKNVPRKWILDCLDDANEDVVIAARTAAEGRTDISPTRVIESGDKVYKRCLGEVIVVAKIPDTADIRGDKNKYGDIKYRANQAEIVDIIGDFFGEKVGISCYDGETQYRVGDVIKILDFDHSDTICSTGFHFFLTLEEARNYNPF